MSLRKIFCSLNYRFCKVEAYLAENRGELIMAADYASRAMDWNREYLMTGRKMV